MSFGPFSFRLLWVVPSRQDGGAFRDHTPKLTSSNGLAQLACSKSFLSYTLHVILFE